MNFNRYIPALLVLLFCCRSSVPAYGGSGKKPTTESFERLSRMASSANNKSKALHYARKWLLKAKKEHDNEQIANAYKALLYLSEKPNQLHLADSMLQAASQSKDNLIIGSAYLTRATVYYGRKDLNKALDNFLEADRYIARTRDTYSYYKVKYGIAQTKYYLGFYDEAISLFRECIDYFKDENDRAYLNSLHCLGLCYNRTGSYQWCTLTNQMGIDEASRLDNHEMDCYFNHSEGVNLCCKGSYKEAVTKLTATIPAIARLKDFANTAVAHFYIGKAYWSLKENEKAVLYFKKVDSVFNKEEYMRPDLREGYENLIDYYKAKKDTRLQLYFINQLLKVDKILERNYKYLLKKIVKEYDTKELIRAKQEIDTMMIYRTVIACGIIFIMFVVMIYLFFRNYTNRKRFEKLMHHNAKTPPPKNIKQANFDIKPELEASILKKLEKFELGKKYLEKDMNLVRMAALLHTNTKYASRIIAKHRNKGTIDYITDLKTDYVIALLKTEGKYRNYTNKALGDEAGFGSTQNFTRSFKNRTGISPTYFINQLKQAGEQINK